ncbi:aromatic ring-hydroxylating dioxygenase subunit alpha [Ruegeria sp. WL0004]|uniref:Aromatic ring-hydroxylating dioxygenase subunit alpha n=1 Tax=Ruegeria marisflavi TaxID=2984152 RepID=A0ABT2WWG9_9RHOB|nr:aromatic ring-hydroxylating dioxygenase subunit alpha [Ruegeria sp. WL0004]MCU9840067.1 aromatic ring-hydroxylating dioxygenase subunit alpha [Ruegeria sp. WL0004]
MSHPPVFSSPLLKNCPASLPPSAYYEQTWFEREREKIWHREWAYAGRLSDLPENTLRRVEIAGQPVMVARGQGNDISAFLNVCPHRGSELCGVQDRAYNGKLISCPYHAWSFDMEGRLRSTAYATPTDDFDRDAHGLIPVSHKVWNGCLFLCLDETPPEFAPDLGLAALDNWPMEQLVTGHSRDIELACNWKVFWENYNECLHCPGIHPSLSKRVPVYKQGIMSAEEASGTPYDGPILEPGTETWTINGQPCGPVFPDLSAVERAAGHTFVTIYPTAFIVAHVDYVRIVSLTPVSPERTRLKAEWLFLPETLAAPGFDLDNVVDFAAAVLEEDGAACEMNQRGLRVSRFQGGRLMPQEFDIKRFHDWVLARLGN